MTTVDIHAHYVSAAVIDQFFQNRGRTLGVELRSAADGQEVLYIGDHPLKQGIPRSLTGESERLERMDAQGIDVQVVSPWTPLSGYSLPSGAGEDLCQLQNDAIADFVAVHPDRLVGAGAVPLQSVDKAIRELERIALTLRFPAVQVGTHINGRSLYDRCYDPFWAAAEDLGVLVLLHPLDPPGATRLEDYRMESLVGFPAETTLAATGLLLGGVLSRHRELRVALPLGGGFLPYQLGRIDRGRELIDGGSPIPSTRSLLDRVFFDAILHSHAALAFLIEKVGAEHVLVGSDYPFTLGEQYPIEAVARLAHITEEQRASILGRTACELLGLEYRPTEVAGRENN